MSRELYDACRGYKHFYNKNKDVKNWNNKYHDIDLSDALNITDGQLKLATHKLQEKLFREFKVHCDTIDIENEIPMTPMSRMASVTPRVQNSYATVEFHDSREFIYCLENYLIKRRNHFMWE